MPPIIADLLQLWTQVHFLSRIVLTRLGQQYLMGMHRYPEAPILLSSVIDKTILNTRRKRIQIPKRDRKMKRATSQHSMQVECLSKIDHNLHSRRIVIVPRLQDLLQCPRPLFSNVSLLSNHSPVLRLLRPLRTLQPRHIILLLHNILATFQSPRGRKWYRLPMHTRANQTIISSPRLIHRNMHLCTHPLVWR